MALADVKGSTLIQTTGVIRGSGDRRNWVTAVAVSGRILDTESSHGLANAVCTTSRASNISCAGTKYNTS